MKSTNSSCWTTKSRSGIHQIFMSHKPYLLALPCYNPTPQQWLALSEFMINLESLNSNFEILVIDDGSPKWIDPDATISKKIQIFRQKENRGKGGALKTAVSKLTNDHKIFAFLDFDLPYSANDLIGICNSIEKGVDFCIGDRSLNSGSHRFSRKIAHKIFRLFMRMIITGGVADTQCGIKAFDAKAIRLISQYSCVNGFLFDIEWIYIALKHKMCVRCWPVTIKNEHESTQLRSFNFLKLIQQLSVIVKNIIAKKYEIPELFSYMSERRKNISSS